MTITHHPDSSTLMSFAAGALEEALSAVVAAHAVMCEDCRKELRLMDGLGGAVMSGIANAKLADEAPVAVSAAEGVHRLRAPELSPNKNAGAAAETISRVLRGDLSRVRWRRLGIGVWHMPLTLSDRGRGDLRLIKVAPGLAMPDHGHGGAELTFILDGSYTDKIGTFAHGDIADLDEDVEHMPVADRKTGCMCLIASERPVRFKGLVARIVQPFIGI